MPEFVFYKNGDTVKALLKADVPGASRLTQQGYQKLFEEINAEDASGALARLADIKKEEALTLHAFMTWPVFLSLVALVLLLITWCFGD